MKNMRLTRAGAELLGTAHADGETRYWIGYYGLAYVADRETDSISTAAQTGELTQSGDYIYNIWQGDMLNGYAQTNPDDTAAATLFGLTLYDKSIRTNYRYVYDTETERNRLVAWKSEAAGHGENTLERKGAAVYMGTTRGDDGVVRSEIPLPAPLYYGGDPSDDPVVTMTTSDGGIPVSADYRYYVGTRDAGIYGWQESSATQEGSTVSDRRLLESISNFNKFHGTVSSEGYGVSSVSSCHNMGKATKLFPISYYNVVNDNGKKLAETQYAGNSPARKPLATAIKFSIDLSPITADAGYTALTYEDGGIVDDQSTGEKDLYRSKYISFKFNRIGIYAVPMTVHRYSTEGRDNECNLQKVQFEIDGDAEPVLFAVADINDTMMSDNPSSDEGGVAKFTLDFILHMGNGDTETEVEQRTAVYYDLYENDATKWYKNQLLASASLSEAVTDLSLEVNALKQHVNDSRECCSQETVQGQQYALKNHTHDYMKNLVDGVDNGGSVRGIYTCEEGDGKGIVSLFGVNDGRTPGAQKACILHSISTWESGLTVTVPDSYLYGEGFRPSAGVPQEDCISFEQLSAIVKVMGVRWIVDNVVTGTGWKPSGSASETDPDNVYVWTDSTHYAKISVTTGEITGNTLNAGSTDMYQSVVIKNAETEEMFRDGYSAGENSITLGEDTASAGKCSIVQGNMAYCNSDFASMLGVQMVKCAESPYMTVTGAYGFDIKESGRGIVFGNGMGISGAAYSRPAELRNVYDSIVGGTFYDDGNSLMCNGVTSSMWLMAQNGPYSYGAEGRVTGSILAGNMMVGGSHEQSSMHNSVMLRFGENPDYRVRGPVDNSVVLGEGYMQCVAGGHTEAIDRTIRTNASVSIACGIHQYMNDGATAWSNFGSGDVDAPSSDYAVLVGGNICKSVRSSLLLSSGNADLGRFSINTRIGNTTVEPYGAVNSVLVGADCQYGERISDTVAIGNGNRVPDGTVGLLAVGDGICADGWYDDEAIAREDFNAAVAEGTLKRNAHYVVLGSGTIKVSNGAGGYMDAQLSGETDGIYAGVYVDGDGIITYSPYSTTQFAINGMSRTVSIGKVKNLRLNPRNLSHSIIVGSGNTVSGLSAHCITMVGTGNTASLMNLSGVSVFGSNVHLDGSDAHAYGCDGSGMPLYPSMNDVQIMCSGMSLSLNSVDPYATHSFSNAIINLSPEYDQSILGIYPHPMYYYSMPTDRYPRSPWNVAYTDRADAPFHIDPNLFSNYRDAWIAEDPVNGATIWANYTTVGGTGDSRWGHVTEVAEARQSESDVYRGYDLYGFPDPFTNKTRAEIRGMIGKPSAPMVYTGGIAIAGKPSGIGEDNYGLIKIGHVSKPVAYISSCPVSGWGTGNLLNPVSVTGTTYCPFGGMVLAVDYNQELDGTMHLVLSRNANNGSIVTIVDGSSGSTVQLPSSGSSVVETPDGTDYMTDFETMLDRHVAPMIRIRIGDSGDLYAPICSSGTDDYTFGVNAPGIGQKFIRVQYSSDSTPTPGYLKITVS